MIEMKFGLSCWIVINLRLSRAAVELSSERCSHSSKTEQLSPVHRCQANFLDFTPFAHAQSNILHIKCAEKIED